MYAFWKYNGFPSICGGKITQMNKRGTIEAKNYPGFVFTPVKILPDESGAQLLADLKLLELKHREALKKFNKKWEREVEQLLCDAGKGTDD